MCFNKYVYAFIPLHLPDKHETKLKGLIYFQAIEEVYYDHLRSATKVFTAGFGFFSSQNFGLFFRNFK